MVIVWLKKVARTEGNEIPRARILFQYGLDTARVEVVVATCKAAAYINDLQ